MSADACKYVKHLVTCPSGDTITTAEKAIAWYIADSHNDQENAAWCSVPTIARENGMSPRRVNELIRSMIDKGVLWRSPRLRDTGASTSNWLHFTAVDGPATHEALVEEEKMRLRGERGASVANESKRQKREGFPQEGCEGDCELPQGGTAEDRSGDCGRSQGETAEDRSPETAEDRRGGLRKIAPLELLIELPSDPPLETLSEPLLEAPGLRPVENSIHRIRRAGELPIAQTLTRFLQSKSPGDRAAVQAAMAGRRVAQ